MCIPGQPLGPFTLILLQQSLLTVITPERKQGIWFAVLAANSGVHAATIKTVIALPLSTKGPHLGTLKSMPIWGLSVPPLTV
jgi:hypothetical protein